MSLIKKYRYPIKAKESDYLYAYSYFFWEDNIKGLLRFHHFKKKYFINKEILRHPALNGHLTLLLYEFMMAPDPVKIDILLNKIYEDKKLSTTLAEANLLEQKSIIKNRQYIESVFDQARNMNLTTSKSATVAATKILHFLYPDLFVILDNAHTVDKLFLFPRSRSRRGEYSISDARRTAWEQDLKSEDYTGLLIYLSGEMTSKFSSVGSDMFTPCKAMLWPIHFRLPYARITDFVYW